MAPARNSFDYPDICSIGVTHLYDGSLRKDHLESIPPKARRLDSRDPRAPGTNDATVLSAVASPSAQHRPGAQLTAPSTISEWQGKDRKFVVTVIPAKPLTKSRTGKEL